MSDTVMIRIGVQSARELELEVEDAEAVIELFSGADEDDVVWVTDARGRRHGIVRAKLVFVIVDPDDTKPGVGFSATV